MRSTEGEKTEHVTSAYEMEKKVKKSGKKFSIEIFFFHFFHFFAHRESGSDSDNAQAKLVGLYVRNTTGEGCVANDVTLGKLCHV